MKKISFFIFVLLTCMMNICYAANNNFKDLTNAHWAYNEVMVLNQNEILNGYSDGTFQPEKEVTREEFLQMLYKAEFYPGPSNVSFIDVEENRWSSQPIKYYGRPIAEERNNELYFYPEKVLTREEAAKLLVISFHNLGSEFATSTEEAILSMHDQYINSFIDKSQISENCKAYVMTACRLGLMNGISNSEFSPKGNLTRAQAAALIYRIKYPNVKYEEKENNKNMIQIEDLQIEKFINNNKIGDWYVWKLGEKIYNVNIVKSNNKEKPYTYVDMYIENLETKEMIRIKSESLESHKNLSRTMCLIEQVEDISKNYGFDIETVYSEIRSVKILKYELDGKIYYQEAEIMTPTMVHANSVENMIFFILNNPNKDKNTDFYPLNKIEIGNQLSKLIKKYKTEKTYCLADNKEVEIKFLEKGKQIKITFNDENSSQIINVESNSAELFNIKTMEVFEKAFGFSSFKTSNGVFLKYVSDKQEHIMELDFEFSDWAINANDFYEFIAFIINDKGLV